jgi:phosphate starvation-inducible PhoH-like protein
MSVALRGNLEDFGIAEVFQLIGQQRKTGVLELSGVAGRCLLCFEGGAIVRASPEGSHEDAALGELLVRCGLLTPEALDAVERERAASPQPLSRALFERGLLSVPQVDEIEDLLTRDTLFELLQWTSGAFHFRAGPIVHVRENATLLPAEQVLMDGLRMVDEARQLRRLVPADGAVFRRSGSFSHARERLEAASPRELEPLERVWRLVDGRLPAGRVMDLSRLGRFDAMRMLAHLVRCGAVSVLSPEELARVQQSAPRPEPASGPFAAAVRFAPAVLALLVALVAIVNLHSRLTADDAPLRSPLAAARAAFATQRVRNAAEARRAATRQWPEQLRTLVDEHWLGPDALTLADVPFYYARRPAGDAVTHETASTRQTLVFDDNHTAAALYGDSERTLRILEQELGIQARARGNEVRLVGDADRVATARKVLEELYGVVRAGNAISARDVREALRASSEQPDLPLSEMYEDVLGSIHSRRRIAAKNLSQRRYIELMRSHDLVFSLGPAGTGKTYLAMALAVAALHRHEVSRVILARPAVEAGEKLGFLPGSMAEKVNPYLRPLYDALHDMMDFEKAARLIERGVIEVAPLAFMRGRTLNDSFVILDEAQNTTSEQMKMFLTRLGFHSKAVVTGDVTQIDLPQDKRSGLVEAARILDGVEGIGFMRFTEADVVRHPLVQEIIRAYERESVATRPADQPDR